MKTAILLVILLAATARAQQLGLDYAKLELQSGRVLTNARVAAFTGDEFRIEHSGGIARVAWLDMPNEWRTAFPLDSEKAKAVAEDETAKKQIASARAELRKNLEAIIETKRQEQLRESQRISNAIAQHQVVVGMDEQAVTQSWGRPSTINRTTNLRGTSEQWVYRNYYYTTNPTKGPAAPIYDGSARYVYIDNGVVTAIQN